MATTGSMTAAVWLAPMVPSLPLPLAQRVERLLTAKPGRDTEDQALWLCEGIIAYAACVRACVAAAVLPEGEAGALARAVASLRSAAREREATVRDYLALLLAASDAIEAVEPGHPLGDAELRLSRTTWVARTQLVEGLADAEIDASVRAGAIDGGIAGVLALWVRLIELRRADHERSKGSPGPPAPAPAWLGSLGDLIVDVLNSPLLAGAELAWVPGGAEGSAGEARRLHGLEGEGEVADADLGRVCWRFDEGEISSHGLLRYWVDEHEFDHVGILVAEPDAAEHLDYGGGTRAPADPSAAVDWDGLRVAERERPPVVVGRSPAAASPAAAAASTAAADDPSEEVAAAVVAERRDRVPIPVIAAALLAIALVLGGGAWLLWSGDETEPSVAQTELPGPAPEPEPTPSAPASEPVAEIVLDADADATETGPERGLVGVRGVGGETGDETGGAEDEGEDEVQTASLWFESERSLGTCKITYEGRTRTANLHLKTRQPEGKLEFGYRCGQYRGRGSIDVKHNRVNGVLFCKQNGSVKVKTVRSNEGRCDR